MSDVSAEATGGALPRPGVVGVLIRLALFALIGSMLVGAVVDAPSFWDGYTDPMGSVWPVLVLGFFSSWVVNNLGGWHWGWRPSVVLLTGLGGTVLVGVALGDPFGPAYGVYVWVWTLAFAGLLAPAFLLAAVLRTPGCEMRSYMHLWSRVMGREPDTCFCPGGIDRFDGVRLFGRW